MNIVSLIIVVVAAPGAAAEDQWELDSNALCGPRCVHYVLGRYGIQCDLVDVIREPELLRDTMYSGQNSNDSGVSLLSMQAVLERRGLEAASVYVPADRTLSFRGCAIAHIAVDDGQGNFRGHFVSLLNPGSAVMTCWDGLAGSKIITPEELARISSGYYLLVRDEPIAQTDWSARPRAITGFESRATRPMAIGWIIVAVVACGSAVYFAVTGKRSHATSKRNSRGKCGESRRA